MTCQEFRDMANRFSKTTIAERHASMAHVVGCLNCQDWIKGVMSNLPKMEPDEELATDLAATALLACDLSDPECPDFTPLQQKNDPLN